MTRRLRGAAQGAIRVALALFVLVVAGGFAGPAPDPAPPQDDPDTADATEVPDTPAPDAPDGPDAPGGPDDPDDPAPPADPQPPAAPDGSADPDTPAESSTPAGTDAPARPDDAAAPDGDGTPPAGGDTTPDAEPEPEPGAPVVDPDLRPGAPLEVDLADPLGPIEAALDELATQGFRITDRTRTVSALQGEVLTATLAGDESDLLRYVLEQVAQDGYQILLAPAGPDLYALVVLRTQAGMGRGVDFVNVDRVRIRGNFRRGESETTLRKFAALPPGGVVPTDVADELRNVGYVATFHATGSGDLEIVVSPGRAIRRIRVRGHIPLSKRTVARVLSPLARPGALARGQCVDNRTRRKNPPASICSADDLACQRWERDEIDRLRRFLFDNGYLEGSAKLGLTCGRDGEADIYVMLNKGRAFRVRKPTITGNASTADQRWIKRMFKPTVGPFIPIPKRVTRKHLVRARERVSREYAEPKAGPGSGSRRNLSLPYPGVRVETNFDQIEQKDLPKKGHTLPLTIDVQLGQGVQVSYLHNDRFGENRLTNQLQLFKRREPATASSAAREAENLRAFYQSKGFLFADIKGIFADFGTLKKISFDINEGPRVRIREITLPRPKGVPPVVMQEIEDAYDTGRKIKKRGRFTDGGARSDLGLLLTELADHGYLCATARIRVALWPEGLDEDGAHAVIDAFSELNGAGHATWLEQQFDTRGLAQIREQKYAGLFVRVEVVPGPRVVTSAVEAVRHVEIPIPNSREVDILPNATDGGAWGTPRMLRDGPLRRKGDERVGGIPLTLDLDRTTERAIVRRYREGGYPLADTEIRWIYTDAYGTKHRVAQAERLTKPEVGMCRDHIGDNAALVDTEITVYEGRKAVFGTTLIRGNFKTRQWVLRREVEWKEGGPYDRRRVDLSRRHIEGVGVVETVTIREQPTDCQLTDDPEQPCVVHEVVSITEAKDRLVDLSWGAGSATLDPLYVFLRPTFPNVWGTAWDVQLDGHVGANALCGGEDCYERSGRIGITRPRIFGSPLTFDILSQIQRRVTPARGQIDSLLGEVRLSWPISDRWRTYFGYVIQAANISKGVVKPTLGEELGCGSDGLSSCRVPNRSEAIVPDLTAGLELGATWQRVDNAFNPDDGFIATGDVLWAAPWFGGRDNWVRLEASWQHFIPLPFGNDRLNFRYMLRYGHAWPIPGLPGANTTSIPEVWRFFGGGTPELGVRGIEPQTMLVDLEELANPYGVTVVRPVAQGGHIRVLGTVAFQVVSVRNFLGGKLAHSLFLDLGILTQRWRHVVPIRDLRRSVGINFIKWDIRIVTVAVGYGVLVPNSIIPQNVRPTDDRNGRFVFDVGATF